MSVFPSVRPLFNNRAKQNNFQVGIVIAIGGFVGLAEWIIDDTWLVFIYIRLLIGYHRVTFPRFVL